jgi:hypothetical protein
VDEEGCLRRVQRCGSNQRAHVNRVRRGEGDPQQVIEIGVKIEALVGCEKAESPASVSRTMIWFSR